MSDTHPSIDEVKDACQKMLDMLNDPQPGIRMWHLALFRQYERIKKVLDQ